MVESAGTTALALLLGLLLFTAVLVLSRKLLWTLLVAISSTLTLPLGVPLSPVSVLSGLGVLRLTRDALSFLSKPIPALLILHALVTAIALLWSSQSGVGLATIATTVTLVLLILFARSAAQQPRTDILRVTAYAMAPMAVAQAIATIVFRVSPQLEDRYLRSALADFLLGDEARLLFTTRPNNVTDPLKAGGMLFVNGNRASMVMAAIALVYLALWIRRRSLHLLLLFTVCMTASVMTGSKTAVVLAIIIPTFFLVLPTILRRDVGSGTRLFTLLLVFVGLGIAAFLASRLPDYLVGADQSAQARGHLLDAASKYFLDHPFTGLGFGGWTERWADDAGNYGLGAELPPHNFLVLEWANAGLGAAVIIAVIVFTLVRSFVRVIRSSATQRDARSYSLLLGALVWVFAHGMFDNTSFYGTAHTLPLFAALVVLTFERPVDDEAAGEPAERAMRRRVHAAPRGGLRS